MENLLANCVEKNLSQFMFTNAIFFCERLLAEFPSEVNLQLLARCYLSNSQAYSAYYILKGSKTPQSRYLFAFSCFKLDLLGEAETALLPSEDNVDEVPGGAAGHYLLGLVYRYAGRKNSSIEQFRMALSFDPLCWEAYRELCSLGAAEEASTVFGNVAFQRLQETFVTQRINFSEGANINQLTDSDKASRDTSLWRTEHVPGENQQDLKIRQLGADIPPDTDRQLNTNGWDLNTPSPVISQVLDAPPPLLHKNMLRSAVEGSLMSVHGGRRIKFSEEMSAEATEGSGRRRSARIAARKKIPMSQSFGKDSYRLHLSPSESNCVPSLSSMIEKCRIQSSKEATTSGQSISDIGSSVDDEENKNPSESSPDSSSLISGISEVLNLLRILGDGHRHLLMYNCQEALLVYQKLSLKQYNTHWVLVQVGKAYFELQDYFNADSTFTLAHQKYPYALEGMDTYSTVLYHLKEEMRLGYLAQELISVDRLSPESWCAVGNCYSLRKDHDSALKMFKRAIQLNERFTYAHTLCGHEFAALEDFEGAERCYRRALSIDTRHYNAWYGLGMTYLHLEKFEFAEHQFQLALKINPRSSVIMCYYGIALHESKNDEALNMMEKAKLTDAKNPLPKYYKANILASLGDYHKAQKVLEELKECAPQESSVHALLFNIYKQLKLYDKAVLHFGTALDLNPSPSDAVKIKAYMERLVIPDELAMEENL
ncbi:PREDICTED: cell division cycle protein 27 homolog A-like isoform X2 [Camelina sativa]|uniref:Cell division cycle protein 27 homolog A-like isoform X2 n=1 Tax=Camelina sativa TaxID=90675 RepID=A0ABM1RT57_CAMSA|nr:PREDICTED: cell division cycle protein 27 homolog A-like isoform X2 [Camelina sativa]